MSGLAFGERRGAAAAAERGGRARHGSGAPRCARTHRSVFCGVRGRNEWDVMCDDPSPGVVNGGASVRALQWLRVRVMTGGERRTGDERCAVQFGEHSTQQAARARVQGLSTWWVRYGNRGKFANREPPEDRV